MDSEKTVDFIYWQKITNLHLKENVSSSQLLSWTSIKQNEICTNKEFSRFFILITQLMHKNVITMYRRAFMHDENHQSLRKTDSISNSSRMITMFIDFCFDFFNFFVTKAKSDVKFHPNIWVSIIETIKSNVERGRVKCIEFRSG